MTPCPRCGTEPPDGALFCPSCGAHMSVGPTAVPPDPTWDVGVPAIPDDLYRRSEEKPVAPDEASFRRPGGTDPEATAVRPVPPPPAPSPSWAHRPGTPEADLLPSERPYTPLPPATRPSRRGFTGVRGVIVLLALLVIAAIVGGVLWFTGGGSPVGGTGAATKSSSAGQSASGSKAAATPSKVQSATATPSVAPSDAFPPSGATLCTGSTTVAVNAATSCEFALKVAAAIPAGASGSFEVTATSPVTQKDYQMACVRGTYTVCTGGVNALVYVK